MRIIGVIPARYRSRRFPGKALVDIAGKPLIQHVYERASACRDLDRLIVATDDRRIEKCVTRLGAECFFSKTRHSCGTERVAEAIRGLRAGVIVNIQGDEVLITPQVITAAIDALNSGEDIACGTVCGRVESRDDFLNADVVKVVVDSESRAIYFSRSPIPHIGDSGSAFAPVLCHVGVYAFTRKALRRFVMIHRTPLELTENLEQLRFLESGMKIKVSLTNAKNFGLNSPKDVPVAEKMLREERT